MFDGYDYYHFVLDISRIYALNLLFRVKGGSFILLTRLRPRGPIPCIAM